MTREEALRKADEALEALLASGEFAEGYTQSDLVMAAIRARDKLADKLEGEE